MDNFFKKDEVNKERDKFRTEKKDIKIPESNSEFNFDNEFDKSYNFSYSNNLERNEVFIDPRDIFTENLSNKTGIQNKVGFIGFSGKTSYKKCEMNKRDLEFKNNVESKRMLNQKRDLSFRQDEKIDPRSLELNGNLMRQNYKKPPHFNNIPPSLIQPTAKQPLNLHPNSKQLLNLHPNTKQPLNLHPNSKQLLNLHPTGNKKMNNQPINYYKNNIPPFDKTYLGSNNYQKGFHTSAGIEIGQNPAPLGNFYHPHRINPRNNSVLNFNQRFIPPMQFPSYKKPCKKLIRLPVDGTALYTFKTFNINFNIIKQKGGINELSFLSYVNNFNETLGIMKVPFKYGTVLSFVFNELKKCNGYYNTNISIWGQLTQVIKHFSWINQIYLFLVYPFEQFFFGHKKIRIYEDEKILNEFKLDFSTFSTNDIDICLSKGKICDMELMMDNIDPCKIKIEGVIILLNFFVDIFQVKFENLITETKFIKNNEIRQDRYNFEERSLFEKLRKNFLSKLSELDEDKSVYLVKKCIEISIEHGKMCKKKYLGFNIDQIFLNKIFNLLVILKNNNFMETEMILDFINICGKSHFYENPFIFKYCYKLCKTDPIFTLEILSNVKFSTKHNKKFLRRLRKFIIPKIDYFSKLFENHQLLDDNKLLENIIRSFVCIKSMKNKFKEIFKKILEHYDYMHKNSMYAKKRNSSDLFKIILVMIIYEDVREILYSDSDLVSRLKEVPGIRDIV